MKGSSQTTAEIAEQDNAWKDLLDRHFTDFMRFFFSVIAAEIDWTRKPVFLDKELTKLGPRHETGKRFADKLAQVWLKNGAQIQVLIHGEVQGRAQAEFNRRMYVYNYRITDRYQMEVVSLGVVTGAAGRTRLGRYETERWGCRLVFEFPVVKLTDWRGREKELEASREPFALVVLAQLKVLAAKGKTDKKYAAKRYLIELLLEKGFSREYVKSLLKFIDWLIQLPPELEERLSQEVEETKGGKKMPYVTSWERIAQQRGEQIGQERGEKSGRLALTLRLLKRKVGKLGVDTTARIEQLSVAQLDKLAEALLDFTNLADLKRWLERHARKNGNHTGSSEQQDASHDELATHRATARKNKLTKENSGEKE